MERVATCDGVALLLGSWSAQVSRMQVVQSILRRFVGRGRGREASAAELCKTLRIDARRFQRAAGVLCELGVLESQVVPAGGRGGRFSTYRLSARSLRLLERRLPLRGRRRAG